MDSATQGSLVTLANFHINHQLTPLFKTLKASCHPPEEVASTPASPLTLPMHPMSGSSQAEVTAWRDAPFPLLCCYLCLELSSPLRLPHALPNQFKYLLLQEAFPDPQVGVAGLLFSQHIMYRYEKDTFSPRSMSSPPSFSHPLARTCPTMFPSMQESKPRWWKWDCTQLPSDQLSKHLRVKLVGSDGMAASASRATSVSLLFGFMWVRFAKRPVARSAIPGDPFLGVIRLQNPQYQFRSQAFHSTTCASSMDLLASASFCFSTSAPPLEPFPPLCTHLSSIW